MKNKKNVFYRVSVLTLAVSIGLAALSQAGFTKSGAETLLNLEAESATLTGNLTKISDPTRSQGVYIQFGEDVPPQQIFYVAPTGSDTNTGTQSAPWKSLFKAAATATAGSHVIFEDGTYTETRRVIVENTGSESAPIVFKARNKHMAKIQFQGIPNDWKFEIYQAKYITIKDFEITQTTIGNGGLDKFINYVDGSDYGRLVGNKIHHAYEDLVKVYGNKGVVIENNILYDVVNEGIDVINADQAIVRNNDISQVQREAIFLKGGTRNSQVYNNYIHQESGNMYVAIDLGGSTDAEFAYSPSGYEGYNLVAFNNTIVEKPGAVILEGLKFAGCDTCGHYNNVVVGANHGLMIENGGGTAKGWTWAVQTRNPTFKNNIVMDCTTTMDDFDPYQGTLTLDYNNVFNCPGSSSPVQPHGIFTDPLLVNKLSDWHLQSGSPARGTGDTIADHPTFTDAQNPAISPIPVSFNRDYLNRATPWDMGAY